MENEKHGKHGGKLGGKRTMMRSHVDKFNVIYEKTLFEKQKTKIDTFFTPL